MQSKYNTSGIPGDWASIRPNGVCYLSEDASHFLGDPLYVGATITDGKLLLIAQHMGHAVRRYAGSTMAQIALLRELRAANLAPQTSTRWKVTRTNDGIVIDLAGPSMPLPPNRMAENRAKRNALAVQWELEKRRALKLATVPVTTIPALLSALADIAHMDGYDQAEVAVALLLAYIGSNEVTEQFWAVLPHSHYEYVERLGNHAKAP